MLQERGLVVARHMGGGWESTFVLSMNLAFVPASSLQQPVGLTHGKLTATQATLSWADVSGESSYQIDRKPLVGGSWNMVGLTGMGETQFTDNTVAAGGDYLYRVMARNGAVASAASATWAVYLALPAAPQALGAKVVTPYLVDLSWESGGRNTSYQVEQAPSAAGPWTKVATPAADATTVRLAAQPATTSYYRIRSANTFGNSAYSNIASVTTPLVAPATPGLTVEMVPGGLRVSQTIVALAESYIVERRISGESDWVIWSIRPSDLTATIDVSVEIGKTYEYRVKAANAAGNSAYSAAGEFCEVPRGGERGDQLRGAVQLRYDHLGRGRDAGLGLAVQHDLGRRGLGRFGGYSSG